MNGNTSTKYNNEAQYTDNALYTGRVLYSSQPAPRPCHPPAQVITLEGPHNRLPPKRVKQAIDYMVLNCGSELSLEKLALYVHLSKYHFAHLFKSTTGQSPHQYLIMIRVNKAKNLLHSSDMPIYLVAEAVGYDANHFIKVFKRITGTTPLKYRRNAPIHTRLTIL